MPNHVVIPSCHPSEPLVRSRKPSRTQLRHASAVRRLFTETTGSESPPDEYQMSLKINEDSKTQASAESSMQAILKEKDIDQKVKNSSSKYLTSKPSPAPYLRASLASVGIDIIADSANMETLMGHRDYLRASFITPESMHSRIEHYENFYHVWAAVTLALDEGRGQRRDIEDVVKAATSVFMVEMGSALIDCLKPGLPHYTFLDPRGIYSTKGRSEMIEQALSIVQGLERKGITRGRIFVTIPATEGGLEIAQCLKAQHSIKTNLAFVSGLAQASACLAAGADAITMSVGPNLQYHETRRGAFWYMLNPHPGYENIKAVACYLKHNDFETKLNAISLRSIDEVQQLSAVNNVCFADWQVQNVRWHRSRIARPPGSNSTAVFRAKQMPYPPLYTKDNLKYLATMSSETKRETLSVLDLGLRSWQVAMTRIVDVIRAEIKRRIDIATSPLSRELTITNEEAIEYRGEAIRSRRGKSLSREKTIAIAFPSMGEDEEIVTPVPQSPLLQDFDDFEAIYSSSEEDLEDMEPVIF